MSVVRETQHGHPEGDGCKTFFVKSEFYSHFCTEHNLRITANGEEQCKVAQFSENLFCIVMYRTNENQIT